jgi:hypothetical protein
MTTIRERVLRELKWNPATRNDDQLLYVAVLKAMELLQQDYASDSFQFTRKQFMNWPGFEAVRRRRQEIQNGEGRYIPTDPEALAARGFYRECPRETLLGEDQPQEIVEAACRKCPKVRTDACHVFGAALAVSRA